MVIIPAVRERCAGIDIGKRTLAVALIVGPADQPGVVTTREFGTTVPELQAIKAWLVEQGCTSVAMESTGSYWIPVKNELEGTFEIMLVCSQKHKPKKGDKSDFRDARGLAHRHRHGMLTPSFLPEKGIVELRDLTRRRKKLLSNLGAEKNRIQKVLEVANVKIGNVVSDVFGISGQKILSVLLSVKEIEAAELADMAKGQLRRKIPQLTETLKGHRMNDHHRWLIDQSVEHIVLLDKQLEALEEKIREKAQPYAKQMNWLQTAPGIKEMTAASIVAEIGPDMSQFPTSRNLASWTGLCPGNNKSAGKKKGGRIKKANKFLISALVQAAWGAVKKRESLFQQKFRRWSGRLGKTKTSIAICHSLLRVVWVLLKEERPYRAAHSEEMRQLERAKQIRHHAKRLRQLGADEASIEEITQRLLNQMQESQPAQRAEAAAVETAGEETEQKAGSAEETNREEPQDVTVSTTPIVRGALGLRARPQRQATYKPKTRKGKGGANQPKGKQDNVAVEPALERKADAAPTKARRRGSGKGKKAPPVDLGEASRWLADHLETQ
ncbi:MAG: IS110 family transposase [Verrucomicrobia bacterium]|nr:IS110 family transposase [Verrucomicrobiota bacterium]